MKGNHAMHHFACPFNGEWSDMAIETTQMKKGKSSNDRIVGNTNDEDTVDIYAYSPHDCFTIVDDLSHMRNNDSLHSIQRSHKEQFTMSIRSDS